MGETVLKASIRRQENLQGELQYEWLGSSVKVKGRQANDTDATWNLTAYQIVRPSARGPGVQMFIGTEIGISHVVTMIILRAARFNIPLVTDGAAANVAWLLRNVRLRTTGIH